MHCMSFLDCVFLNVSSNRLPERINSYIGCMYMVFSSMCFQMCSQRAWEHEKSHCWFHIFDFSPRCDFKCVLKVPAWENNYLHWLHLFCVSRLKMCLQTACLSDSIITLVTSAGEKWILLERICIRAVICTILIKYWTITDFMHVLRDYLSPVN